MPKAKQAFTTTLTRHTTGCGCSYSLGHLLSRARRVLGSLRFRYSNRRRLHALKDTRNLRLHLGCGDDHLDGFINIDFRRTRSTDISTDLVTPPLSPGTVEVCFSHAFFEHLYREKRLVHLRCVVSAMTISGVCCYIGLPYFPGVARAYLNKAPGVQGPVFNLFEVYRYTHGDPERVPSWWHEQLHKSLFDEEELSDLLREAGFTCAVLFSYKFPGEEAVPSVSMGFYARKCIGSKEQLQQQALQFLQPFDGFKLEIASVFFLSYMFSANDPTARDSGPLPN